MRGWGLARADGDARAAVFAAQFRLLAAATVVVVAVVAVGDVVVGDGVGADSPAFLVGLVGLPVVTVVTAVVPWDVVGWRWQLAVPVVDIVVLASLRLADPDAGFGVLLVLPVIWLATGFGGLGALAGVGAAAAALGVQTALTSAYPALSGDRQAHPAAVISLVCTLSVVAGLAFLENRRQRAQQTLLGRQTRWIEDSLDRAQVERHTLRDVVNGVPFVVLAFDARGRLTDTNAAARRLVRDLGLTLDTHVDRLPGYESDGVTPVRVGRQPQVRALRGEEVADDLYWLGHAGGRRVALMVSCLVQRHVDQQTARVVLIGRDVTAELEEARAREDALATVAHEFRTPLGSILGYLDLAAEDPGTGPDAARHIEVALRNTERLRGLVDDLVSARSRRADAEIVLRTDLVDLRALVTEAVQAALPVARHRIVAVAADVPRGPVVVPGDAFRLRQVLDNLLANAVKYNRPGGSATVSVGRDGDDALLVVSDTGEGIGAADRDHVFEPFFRTGRARASATAGTGLGLAVCAEIVALHGGDIEVDSEVGVGTTMTVRLPRTGAPDAGAGGPGAGGPGAGGPGAGGPGAGGRPARRTARRAARRGADRRPRRGA